MSKPLTIEGDTILSAVTRALVKAFPDIDVYKETVNQGCTFPYFMIYCEDFSEQKLMRDNYLQTFVISVIYQYKELPETSYCNFNTIGYKLSEILDLIELQNGEKVRGTNKNWYPDNQKLEFYINYTIKVYKEQETKPKMNSQKVNVYTK